MSIGLGALGTSEKKVSFSRDILPILSDKCFKCHGPDAGARQANLRLDTSEGAFADRGGRWAIVPSKPEASLLVQKIHSANSPMPPISSGKSLTDKERDLLTRWIKEGAQYGKLWSFEPIPEAVALPRIGGAWAKSDLDRFIFDRLLREGLRPSPPASKERWLRRVTLDITGLPPTVEEIQAFLSDTKKGAFERVADRLLASPHFGERMAVDWLDSARYSDSYGYQSDLLMPSWPYRDWVVKAFNENLPYREFIVDQIAGDLLENPTRDQILATAFNRLHRQSNEGGSIPEEYKTEYAVDRVVTFGTAVLGLTVGCARCHDHKFDPITQREFYQLYAYFNNIDEFGLLLSTEIVPTPSLLLPTQDQEKKWTDLLVRNEEARQALEKARSLASSKADDWLKTHPKIEGGAFQAKLDFESDAKPAEKLGQVQAVDGHMGKGLRFDGDNGLAVRGLPARERWEPFTWSFWIRDPGNPEPVVLLHRSGGTDVGFCGFDLILENGYLTARVMRHWPGNALAVRSRVQVPKERWTHIGWSWDGSGRVEGLKLYVSGEPVKTEVQAHQLWKRINAYGDLGPSGGDWCFAQRFRDAGFKGGELDDVAFAARELSHLEVKKLCDPNSPNEEVNEHYVTCVDPGVQAARSQMLKAQSELAQFEEGIQEISVMWEASPEIPAYVLARGQYDAPKTEANKVSRGVPRSLPGLKTNGRNNRLDLARWATAPDNPLTARVAVNRFWQLLFGSGLVETSENFGIQGSQPTHPELLDYLARRFIDSNWNVKAFLKELVLSSTYRQDSAVSKKLLDKDPLNRFLARGPSHRLSAEMMRDTALAASGLLEGKLGGPPVNPYQPSGIWQEFNTMSPGFVQSKGSDLYRRSLYSTWKRTTPVPNMMLFDANARESCITRRASTNTPLQALVLLNDIQFVEVARSLGELVLRTERTDEGRIQMAFGRLAGRKPDEREMELLQRTLDEQRIGFRKNVNGAAKLISIGDSKPDPSLRPSELAAITVCVQAILNSDAVVWKR